MTTNAPRFRAGTSYGCAFSGCNFPEGGCAGNCALRRVDASQLKDDRAVFVAGNVETNRSTLPHATEFAGPEPIDFASFRPLVIAGLVVCIALLVGWRFV